MSKFKSFEFHHIQFKFINFTSTTTLTNTKILFNISVDPTKDLDLSVFYNDRLDNYEEDDTIKNRFKGNEFDDLLPFNDLTLSRFQARNRQRRGIIDECCRNPCSWSNLVKYCPTMG